MGSGQHCPARVYADLVGGVHQRRPRRARVDAPAGGAARQRAGDVGDGKSARGLAAAADQGVPAIINQVGPMWQVFFGQDEPVTRYRQARASDQRFFAQFQAECQERGVYFHNFNFERFFASTAHTMADVGASLDVIAAATKVVKKRAAAGQAV